MVTAIDEFIVARYSAKQAEDVLVFIEIGEWVVTFPVHHLARLEIRHLLIIFPPYLRLCIVKNIYFVFSYETLPFCISYW